MPEVATRVVPVPDSVSAGFHHQIPVVVVEDHLESVEVSAVMPEVGYYGHSGYPEDEPADLIDLQDFDRDPEPLTSKNQVVSDHSGGNIPQNRLFLPSEYYIHLSDINTDSLVAVVFQAHCHMVQHSC